MKSLLALASLLAASTQLERTHVFSSAVQRSQEGRSECVPCEVLLTLS